MARKPQAKKRPTKGVRNTANDDVRAQEAKEYKYWFEELKRAKKAHSDYFERGKKIVKLYKDERAATVEGLPTKHRMNILWSNVSVLQPAIYSDTPEPNVSRRFLDKDPVSRLASLIIERNLITAQELFDFDYPMERVRDDYLLCGRGIVWVRFVPEIGLAPQKEPVREVRHADGRVFYRAMSDDRLVEESDVKDDDNIGKYYETEPVESVLSYGLDIDHVMWNHFLHEPVGDWTKCGWVARMTMMKRKQLEELSPDKGKFVNLNRRSEQDDDSESRSTEADCAEVWEIWHKATKLVIWITDGLPEQLLKVEEDPLRLSTFWPCPRPLLATVSTDSMIPVPDYVLYQDQAAQIDLLTDRIRILLKACRVVGVFNSANEGLQQMIEEGDENDMIPVDNWVWFQGTGGIKGNVDWFPLDQIIVVLKELFAARQQMRQDLYEVTGISDLIRGATMASETATAQQLKANFGNLRLKSRQAGMSRVARDTLRKMAEIQCEHYPDEVLIEMSGVLESDEFKVSDPAKQQEMAQRLSAALQLIRSDKLRTFKIDIETDATVAADQEQEKQTRVEFLTAVAPFLEKAAQVGVTAPQFVPLLLKMLDFGVRGFRTGRTLESAIEGVIDTVEKMQAASQGQPQEKKDPEAEAKVAELNAKIQLMQQELATAQAEAKRAQAEAELKLQDYNDKRAREAEQFAQQMLKLTEDVEFRRAENEKRLQELSASIKLKELQIADLENKRAFDDAKAMAGEPAKPQEQIESERATHEAIIAKARADLAESQVRYAETLQKKAALGDLSSMVDTVGTMTHPIDLSSPMFGKPKPKRVKKLFGFVRNPETREIEGATQDEIEIEDEENDDGTGQGTPAPAVDGASGGGEEGA